MNRGNLRLKLQHIQLVSKSFSLRSSPKPLSINPHQHLSVRVFAVGKLEVSLGRPPTRHKVWKKTHTKIEDGKEVWVSPWAEDTYELSPRLGVEAN